MDEAHNLVRQQTQYLAQLRKLRGLLFMASRTVLVGFTGTPILNEVRMRLIWGRFEPAKGFEVKDFKGFSSNFSDLSWKMFLTVLA